MEGLALVPPTRGSEGFVELARSATGRVFEKHILNFGTLLYPGVAGGKVEIDQAFANTLVKNFKNKVCDIVQVPIAGAKNEHTEDPLRNIGEVVGLTVRDDKIYAQIDARDDTAASRLGKTLLGASAMLGMNYTDTRTGSRVGPTLLHVAITNRPYIPGLDDFSELLAASADGRGDAVVLTAQTKENRMLDDLIAELKADHGIDLLALQQTAAKIDGAVALSNAVTESLRDNDMLVLSNADATEPTAEDLVSSIKAAGEKIVSLSAANEEITNASLRKEAQAHVKNLVRTGHILPKAEEASVELFLTNPTLFDALLPEQPLIRLSHEEGQEPIDHTPVGTEAAEIARLTASPAAAPYVHTA